MFYCIFNINQCTALAQKRFVTIGSRRKWSEMNVRSAACKVKRLDLPGSQLKSRESDYFGICMQMRVEQTVLSQQLPVHNAPTPRLYAKLINKRSLELPPRHAEKHEEFSSLGLLNSIAHSTHDNNDSH